MPGPLARFDLRAATLGIALAGVAGFVDAIGFGATGGLFVSFMSGNSTRAGVAAAQGATGLVLVAAGLVVAFALGVAAGVVLGRAAGWRRAAAVQLLAALALCAAALAGDRLPAPTAALLLAFAMGAINAVFERGGAPVGLTYVTGVVVGLGRAIVDGLAPGWWRPVLAWAALIGGALLGAIAFAELGARAMWLGALLLGALALSALGPLRTR